jgi:hypothetical protein
MLIRVDDFPHGGSVEKPDRWQMMEHLMDNLNLPIMLACVPNETTQEDIDRLRCDKRITIGVHGFWHNRNELGKDHVEWAAARCKFYPTRPTVFVAPYNEYTEHAVKMAAMAGYTKITAGPETNPNIVEWVVGTGIKVIRDDEFYGRSGEIVTKLLKTHTTVGSVNLHLTWEFREKAESLRALHDILVGCVEEWE